ncbi:hypothetical protein M0811_05988 [Anaeramoeba ignava]|uniref:Uncharacterized protein n=1 Tax=Anaeramoeba ignava TaxID=1746090 RepID=A0A9Q0LUE4_ANAIG|nr:hypothetical protein M0811_05988 [Anaeramoeba ignava]
MTGKFNPNLNSLKIIQPKQNINFFALFNQNQQELPPFQLENYNKGKIIEENGLTQIQTSDSVPDFLVYYSYDIELKKDEEKIQIEKKI